tara:strand:+ start:632 stop:1456 length:825 start_codon:yes stop_codon:yes gene_type:complete
MPGAASFTLVNGRETDQLPLSDRGLAYGDGLFETLRIVRGTAPLQALHLQRLQRGGQALRLPLPSELSGELSAAAKRLGDGVLKLIVTRGSGQRGYAMSVDSEPSCIISASPLPEYPEVHAEQGIHLYACSTRLAQQPLLAGIKHLNRLEQVLARSEWRSSEFAEGLVCDQHGQPIECTMSNLFLYAEGGWVTPELTQCGVQGVMRDWLIAALQARGEPVQIRQVTYQEFLAADEVMCCNSLFGVWPVVQLADRQWPVGVQTRQMQSLAKQVYS